MGMPHRGRLNVLCNLLHKPAGLLFGEMVQAVSEFHVGDVQYHQGECSTLSFPRQVHPTLSVDKPMLPHSPAKHIHPATDLC